VFLGNSSVLYKVKECNAKGVEAVNLDFLRQCFEINEARGILYLLKTMSGPENLAALLDEFSLELSEKIEGAKTSKEKNQIFVRILRMLNNLHEQEHSIRFSILNHLKAEHLVALAILWRHALYTSSFNTVLDRILIAIREKGFSLYGDLIVKKPEDRAVFFEALSAYNRLFEVLSAMSAHEATELMVSDVKNLSKSQSIRNAIAWMEYLLHPEASLDTKNVLRQQISDMAIREEISSDLMALYPKGSVLLTPKTTQEALIALMCRTYSLFDQSLSPSCQELERHYRDDILLRADLSLDLQSLRADGLINVQRHVFYNDLDGSSTYHYFRRRHELLPDWRIDSYPTFEVFSNFSENTGVAIRMIANLPKFQSVASVDIETYNLEMKQQPSVFVFRGHSYHVVDSLKYLNQNTRLALIGSCGGFENLETVLMRSPYTQMILTKGTGTAWINNLLVPAINKWILSDAPELNWLEFKQDLRSELEQAMQRFPNRDKILNLFDSFYVFPHENIGFIMMRSWMQYLGNYGDRN